MIVKLKEEHPDYPDITADQPYFRPFRTVFGTNPKTRF